MSNYFFHSTPPLVFLQYAGGTGTVTAFLRTGGDGGGSEIAQSAESFNGISWTTLNTMPANYLRHDCFGTTAAAVSCGGSGDLTQATEYDGTTWSVANSLNTGREFPSCIGTESAGLVAGGRFDGITSCEEYDGTSFSSCGALNTAVTNTGLAGTLLAALSAYTSGSTNYVETFDGTSWESANLFTVNRQSGPACFGVQTDATLSGGYQYIASSEEYNGVSWAASCDMLIGEDLLHYSGSSSSSGMIVIDTYNQQIGPAPTIVPPQFCSQYTAGSTGSSVSTRVPIGTTEGDLLIILVIDKEDDTISTPTNYTLGEYLNHANCSMAWFWKFATADDNYLDTVTVETGLIGGVWAMQVRYRGVTEETLSNKDSNGITLSSTITLPGGTGSEEGSIIISLIAIEDDITLNDISGYTERVDYQNTSSGVTLHIEDQVIDTDTLLSEDVTLAASDYWAAFAICVNPSYEPPPTEHPTDVNDSTSISEYVSMLREVFGSITCGHITDVVEDNIFKLSDFLAGTGSASGTGDSEKLTLSDGQEMVSETFELGEGDCKIDQNKYGTGEEGTLYYRTAATRSACDTAGWTEYTGTFTSLGFVGFKVTM